jgi:hypothetical protein
VADHRTDERGGSTETVVPDVLTILMTHETHRPVPAGGAGPGAPDDDLVAAVTAAGGRVVTSAPPTACAVFHLASDAAAAAMELAATPGGSGPADAARPKVALCTGEVTAAPGALQGPAFDRARALVGLAAPGQILVSGTTAVMVSHALPPGAELVDLGSVVTHDRHGERVHELRPPGTVNEPEADGGASNLGWARRAAAALVVGRDEPVAALERLWERVLAGEHHMVVLSGDPGIGKTTVAAEVALRLHATGAVVLYGRWDEESLAPYQAVREALGTYAAACPKPLLRRDLAEQADEIARLLPDIGAAVGGVRAPLTDDPGAERQRLFDAIGTWLDAIAARRPVLAVLDDLQWADRSSLLLLRHLLDARLEHPLLLVVTLRDGEVEGMGPLHTLGLFEQRDDVERLEVEGLRADDIERMVEQAVGRPVDHDDAELVRWLTDETSGNPLFVSEILRGASGAEATAALREVRDRLPERLHDVVRWRLGRLAPGTVGTLAVASVLGEEFALDVLGAVAGTDLLVLRHELDEALRAGLLRAAATPGRLGFSHAVVRRALQEELPAEQAVDLHGRIAAVLADRVGDGATAAEVAHHHLHAADEVTAGVAIRWARSAADQARRETAYEGGVWFLSRATDVHDRYGDDDELACELRLELAEAHDRAGEFTARDRRHLEAAELARALDRTDLLTRAALGYGGRLPATPPPNPAARELLDDVLPRLPPTDSRARALALARLAHLLHLDAPHAERARISGAAVAMARRLDAPVVLASTLVSRCLALDGPDDVDEQLEIGAEVIRIGEQTGDPDLVLQGARTRIQPLFVVGAHDAANDLAERFTELADDVRHPDHLRITAMWRTMWATLQGRFDEATWRSDALRDQLARAGHSQATAIHVGQTIPLLWMRGDADRLRAPIDVIRGVGPYVLNGWSMAAWLEAASGDINGARGVLAEHRPEILEVIDRNYLWMPTVVACAIAAATVRDPAWAAAAHRTLSPYSGRNCVMGYAAYLGAVDHHLGALDAVLGRNDDAVAHLEAALDRHRTIGARPYEALTERWLANVLTGRGRRRDVDRAADLVASSGSTATELGLGHLPQPLDVPARRG